MATTVQAKTASVARAPQIERNPADVDDPVLSFFLDYWRKSVPSASQGIPLFSSFRPKEVRANLAWVVVVDVFPDMEDFRYRVIGTCVAEYFARNSTGLTLSEAFCDWDAPSRDGVVSLFRAPCLHRLPFRYSGPGFCLPDTKKFLPDFDSLYLPYSTDGTRIDRVVNAFAFDYRKFRETTDVRLRLG
jgi:hypothetical protein